MAITGQNSVVNQFVPTFVIKNLTHGQGFLYDSTKRAFVNSGAMNVKSLGDLYNVSPTVNNVTTIPDGQALVFDAATHLWTNKFVDYNTLINKPLVGTTFISLSDTAKPSLPSGYVLWNSTGTQLVYSTTIPAGNISGLAQVATTGNFNDLSNKPTSLSYAFAGLLDTNKTILPNGFLRWNSTGTQVVYIASIPAAQVSGLATVATTGNFNDLSNKPTAASYTLVGLSDTNNVAVANGILIWDPVGTQVIYSTTIASTQVSGLSVVATTGSFNDLLNKPTSNTYTLTGLSDTNNTAVANGILIWNSLGTEVEYVTTISTTQITGLATVATSGSFNDLTNKPTSNSYTLTGLSDTDNVAIPNGILIWNGAGTSVQYSTTISSTQVSGLATVATSGSFNDLTNKPTSNSYTFIGLSDTNDTAIANGFLKWNASSSEVIYVTTIPAAQITGLASVATAGTLGSLSNVSPITNTLNNTTDIGKLLSWSGTIWTSTSAATLDAILPGTNGQIIYNNAGVWTAAATGVTSGVQAYDAGLTALAAKSSTGILAQTGADTYSSISLIQPAAGITITNASGVSGNPTFALANDLAALEGLTTNGLIVRTSDGVAVTRSITGNAGRVVVSNGDGIVGNPTVDIALVTDSGTGSFLKLTTDTYGRVTGTTPVVAGDITPLISSLYVDSGGDSMTGSLIMTSGATVTGIPTPINPSDAANKIYVDNAVAGFSWKVAAKVSTTVNITLSAPQTIDGISVVASDRVLVKNQTNSTENGIYIVQTGAWTRSSDANTPQGLDGAAIFVQQGTLFADTGWVQTNTIVTVGVSNVLWSQFSGGSAYVNGTGLSLVGNTFSVVFGAGIVELPSNSVGLNLYNPTTGALILTSDGTTRSSAAGTGLQLLLPAGSGLTQDATGLYIPSGAITNTKLANSTVSLAGDSGTGSVALGGTLTVNGNATQGITVSSATNVFTVTASNATSSQKGVASFGTTDFTVTAGAVTLNTVGVAKGGTGAVTFATGQLLYGNGTSPIQTNAGLAFNGTDTLTVGTSLSITGTTVPVISSTTTNTNIQIVPNGTGSVVVGSGSQGKITSSTSQTLLVTGLAGITIAATTGNAVVALANSTTPKLTVTGPTASDYATGLTNSDIPNKYYVDTVAGSASGSVKAVKATVSLITNTTVNIGTILPANSTVLSVKVNVTSVDTTALLTIGDGTTANRYMPSTENDCAVSGIYISEVYDTAGTTIQIVATVSGSSGAGSANVIVEYQLL